MQNRFAAAHQTLTADPLVPAAAAQRVVTRLAMLSYSTGVTAADVCGKPLSEVVRLVAGPHVGRTTATFITQALRSELVKR